jgi:hypothetical protein
MGQNQRRVKRTIRHKEYQTKKTQVTMPLPTRQPNEDRHEFIGRCMADSKAIKEFPEAAQRYAVCQYQAEKSQNEN